MLSAMSKKQQEDPAAVARTEAAFGKCVAACADTHAGQLQSVVKNVDAQLKGLL
jgi:hypothetical protein